MNYAPHSAELFAPPQLVSPYTYAQQQILIDDKEAHTATLYKDKVLGIRLANGTALLSVPYLRNFAQACDSMPSLEAAEAFAQTDQAVEAAEETFERFSRTRAHYVNNTPPVGRLTFGQVGNILHIPGAKARIQADLIGAAQETGFKNRPRDRHIAAAHLSGLFSWFYPPDFPVTFTKRSE